MRLAAAANGGQELLRCLGRQHKLDLAGRLFQGLEQGVGRDGVHALCRKNQHHLGVAARAGELREADSFAGSIDLDFFTGFAFFSVQFFLGFLVQRPAQLQKKCFWHEHAQVSMRVHIHRVATAAVPAGTLCRWGFAQPGPRQSQRQFKLPQTRGPAQKPGMTALRQQALQLVLQPRCQCRGGRLRRADAHASQPLATTTANTACHTAGCVWAALIRAKRAGSALSRRA